MIFEIYIMSGEDFNIQYLNQDSLTAFTNEQEVLIGWKPFKVVPGQGNFKEDGNGILII